MTIFDDIRPYSDEELQQYASLLLKEDKFINILKYFFKDDYIFHLDILKNAKTIEEFQMSFIRPILTYIINLSISDLTYSGQENIPTNKACLFMSNHRDIVMDPALLDYVLSLNGFKTAEIAIGNNLLIEPWIEMMVRLNRCFIVKRNLSGRDLLKSSQQLSSYINHTICKKNNHVWIAQREGRAKDGNDCTHSGILRMLAMASDEKNLAKAIANLNIVPVSISYEFDPCDGFKAKELYSKSIGEKFEKTMKDDLKNMEVGIRTNKGRVHFHFSKPISSDVANLVDANPKDLMNNIISIIDDRIHKGMKINSLNKAAVKLLNPDDIFFEVDKMEMDFARIYFKNVMDKFNLNKEAYKFLVEQYANPALNSIGEDLIIK